MHGPQARLVRLGGIVGVFDDGAGFERFVVRRRMVRREGDVVRRMPVFGGDFYCEWKFKQVVDGGEYIAAFRDGKGTVLRQCIASLAPGCVEVGIECLRLRTGGQKSS